MKPETTMPQPDRRTKAADEPPSRRNWADRVAEDVSGAALAAFRRAGFTNPALVLRWPQIAGVEVARLAQPLRLSEGASGGVLTLKAEPGAAVFLQHETRELCARINAWLGRDAVVQLKFVQGALTRRAPRPTTRKPAANLPTGDPARTFAGPEKLHAQLVRLGKARQRSTD